MRLDKFLQLSRLVRRRTIAQTLCDHGRVRLNGTLAKAASPVKPGDVITIIHGDRRLIAKVVTVPNRPRRSKELVDVLARVSIDDLRAPAIGLPPVEDDEV